MSNDRRLQRNGFACSEQMLYAYSSDHSHLETFYFATPVSIRSAPSWTLSRFFLHVFLGELSLIHLIQHADMQERPHVLYVLQMLRNTFKESPEGSSSLRLPSFTTLLLSYALRGVFYPENFIYPLTARFLLQRPELDITDVPMLYAMLYSSSDDWKRERTWILKFIADAMLNAGEEEWEFSGEGILGICWPVCSKAAGGKTEH